MLNGQRETDLDRLRNANIKANVARASAMAMPDNKQLRRAYSKSLVDLHCEANYFFGHTAFNDRLKK